MLREGKIYRSSQQINILKQLKENSHEDWIPHYLIDYGCTFSRHRNRKVLIKNKNDLRLLRNQ